VSDSGGVLAAHGAARPRWAPWRACGQAGGWSERVGAGRVGWVVGLRPENLRELEWSGEDVKGAVVDFG
jgi:hypothetical protein